MNLEEGEGACQSQSAQFAPILICQSFLHVEPFLHDDATQVLVVGKLDSALYHQNC